MTQPSRPVLIGFVGFVLVMASPVHAEGNRLLPFWAQPYPYGFAYVEQDPLPPCRPLSWRERMQEPANDPRCQVVLHARD